MTRTPTILNFQAPEGLNSFPIEISIVQYINYIRLNDKLDCMHED